MDSLSSQGDIGSTQKQLYRCIKMFLSSMWLHRSVLLPVQVHKKGQLQKQLKSKECFTTKAAPWKTALK